MRQCPRCGQTNVDSRVDCIKCGAQLLVSGNQAQINFLLGEMPLWVARGWVAPEQADMLAAAYRERWQWLTFGPRPAEYAPPSGRPATTAPLNQAPASPPTAGAEPRRDLLASFLEQASITYWHLVGGLLLLAGLAGLVACTWNGIGRYLVFALLIAMTGGLFALGRSELMRAYPIGQTVLLAVASLLAPLDVITASRLGLFGPPLPFNPLGLLSTMLSLPLYGWLSVRGRSRSFTIFAAIDGAAAVHFALQTLLPNVDGSFHLALYGLFYVPLGALYLALSTRAQSKEASACWQWAAHAVVVTSLVLSFATSAGSTSAAAALWMTGALYAGAALVFNTQAFAGIAAGAMSIALLLTLNDANVPVQRWYLYVLAAQTLAVLYLAVEASLRRAERDGLAGVWQAASTVVSTLCLIGQLFRAILYMTAFPHFVFKMPDLVGGLACAAATIAMFRWTASRSEGVDESGSYTCRTIADVVYGYAAMILIAIGCTAAHVEFNASFALITAAAGLWIVLRRDKIAGVFTLAAFGFSCLYFSQGASYAWTLTGLLVEMALASAITVRREIKGDDGAAGMFARLAISTATAATLLWQTHLLPWLSSSAGIDENYGFGLALIGLVCLLIVSFWRSSTSAARRAIVGAAITLGVVNVVTQLAYAALGVYAVSPIVMMGIGAVLMGVIAVVRGSDAAVHWALGLTAGAYVVFMLGVAHLTDAQSTVGLEVLAAVILFLAAVTLAVAGSILTRPVPVYGSIAAAAVGYGQLVHALVHPSVSVLALYLLPVAVVLFGASTRRGDNERLQLWEAPMRRVSVLLSTLAISTCVWPIAHSSVELVNLASYGLLAAAIAVVRQRVDYAAVSAFAFAFLGWRIVQTLSANGVPNSMLALRFDLLSLLWIPAAIAATRLPRARFAGPVLYTTSVICSTIAALMSTVSGQDIVWVETLLVTGSALLGCSTALRDIRLQHAGICVYLLAYAGYLWHALGPWSVDNADVFVIPAGLYVLFVGTLLRRRAESRATAKAADWIGALMILTPTFIGAWAGTHAFLHAGAVALEAAAFTFGGIGLRRKAFAVTGTGFIIGLVCLELQGPLLHIHWSIYATLLGAVIIGSALYFEKRREEVLHLGRRIREELNDWE